MQFILYKKTKDCPIWHLMFMAQFWNNIWPWQAYLDFQESLGLGIGRIFVLFWPCNSESSIAPGRWLQLSSFVQYWLVDMNTYVVYNHDSVVTNTLYVEKIFQWKCYVQEALYFWHYSVIALPLIIKMGRYIERCMLF